MKIWATLVALAVAPAAPAQEATLAQGATLRLLDKVTGQLEDVQLLTGQTAQLGQIDINLGECRYPTGNPAGDAFAFLEIQDRTTGTEVFGGWMVASSPALNALDHPRYDVWVIRCRTS